MSDPMRRVWLPLLIVATVLILMETVLRLIFGNLAIGDLMKTQPGDGRCVALEPGREVSYTGHWLRTAPVIQEVNSYGFRGPDVPPALNGRTRRLALLGDSFTYGVGVSEGETFAAELRRLQRAGRGTDVLNFGVPALNLEDVTQHYAVQARRWKPDVSLYFMWVNDLDAPFCETVWARGILASGVARHANRLVLLRLPSVLANSFMNRITRRTDDVAPLASRLSAGLKRFRDRVAEDRSAFGVVALGNPLRTSEGDKLLASLTSAAKIPLLDLQAVVRQDGNRLTRDTHLSPAGHRAVAHKTAQWLDEVFRFRE